MRKLLIKIGILFLLSTSLLEVILYFESRSKNYISLVSHEMNVKLCAERLDTMKNEPKIIIIGGSGCGFGIDSRVISSYFNMPVVNTGTHASIGLRLQMEMFKKYVSDGDIVVAIPEYSQYTNMFYLGGDATVLRILNLYPEGYSSCPLWQRLYISQYIPQYYEEARATAPMTPDDSPYSIMALNEFGDVTAYEERKTGKVFKAYGELKQYNPLVKNFILGYKKYTESRGACFVLLPPALSYSSYCNSIEFIDRLYDRYNHKGEQMFSDKPSACTLPDSLYYDTPYHLTSQGVAIRTNQLVNQIEVALLQKNKSFKPTSLR